jgi:RHS repeat-associated protein
VTTRTYDADDNLLTETNPAGKTRSFTYDALGRRLSESDALGHTVRYTYNGFGQMLTYTDADGRVATNTYDAHGNVTATRDALGNATTFTNNARGEQTSVTDPLGHVTSFEYDGAGNVTKATDPLGHVTTYAYDANNRRLTESATRTVGGAVETLTTAYQYDKGDRLLKVTRPDGTATETVHDAVGQKVAAVDGLGRRVKYQYDELGQPVRVTHPDGKRDEIGYDAEGRRTRTIDGAGRATLSAYDSLGRLEKTTYADGTSVTTSYDAAARVAATTDARGHATRYEYDAAGRQTKITDPLGNVTVFAYDARGNRSAQTDARGQTTAFEYDAEGRLTRTVHPDGTTETLAYDAAGRLAAKTDQAGRTTRFEYDARGKLTKVTDALGGVARYAYDEAGNLLAQTDANNRTTSYEYDRAGRRTRRTLPLGMSETYAYDEAGNLTSHVDFRGKRTAFAYDARDRLLTKAPDASLGEPAITFAYTDAGQRASMSDASGVTNYTYDADDRLTAKQTQQGTLAYAYDAAGNLVSVRSSNAEGVSINYAYDAANRLAAVTDNRLAAGATTYAYDANHNATAVAYPNGVTNSFAYDALNRPTNVSASKSGVVASYAYTLGAAGHRLSVVEHTGRAVGYSYDALHRLTGETVSGDPAASGSITYTYDAVGNRLTRDSTVGGVGSTASAYDENNRLVGDAHDANGNTLASGGSAFAYDFENRLSSAGGGAVRYVYDGDGNRVAKVEGGVTTRYLVDTNNPTGHAQVVEELRGGAVVRQYTYGHDLISQRQIVGGQWQESFYGYDGHGSVRYLTDAVGAVTDTYTYDAFGTLLARTGATPNEHLYAGERFDAGLGLYYLRARYLNPAAGRFLTMDTVEGELEDPPTRHLYAYVHGDPVNFTDPSGNTPHTLTGLQATVTILNTTITPLIRGVITKAALQTARKAIVKAGIRSVRELKKNPVPGRQIHHLIEQRLWKQNKLLQKLFPHVDDMPGISLTPAQHQVITNLWRGLMPYRNQAGWIKNPSLSLIMRNAATVYAAHPEYFQAVLLTFILDHMAVV